MVDKTFNDSPHDHTTLLQELATHRANEESQCRLLSEMQEEAVLRLVAYCKVDDNDFANARFLDLKEAVGEGGDSKKSNVVSEVAAETSLREMVKDLNDAFEKQGIDMTIFKPNQFAALSVYYARFLRKNDTRPRNGLNRWCFGLRAYIAGKQIESAADKKEHLASRCLPMHYDASGVAQPAGLDKAGRAIATAPVTCELCHVGLSGHDKLAQHCAKNTEAWQNIGNESSTKLEKQASVNYHLG